MIIYMIYMIMTALQKNEHEEDISDSDLPKEVPKLGPPNEPSKSESPREAPKPESVRTLPVSRQSQ